MKRLSIALLAATIGVSGVTVGAAEVCANTSFDQAWMQKVRSYTHWNNDPKNAKYVKEHGLKTRDMSKQTASMKRAMKALEVMCDAYGMANGSVLGFNDFNSDGNSGVVPTDTQRNLFSGELLEVENSGTTGLIAAVDYPLYDNPSRSYSDGYGPGYSWFGGGGYVGGRPSAPPVTPPVIVPTPEPSTFVLSAVPMLALIAIRRRK